MNTPEILTERFRLRRAYEADIPALFTIYRDPEVMRFVPVFPANDIGDMRAIWEEKWARCYDGPAGYQYVIALKNTDAIVGYVHIDIEGDAHDLGYGLRRDWWGRGAATESASALLERAKADGIDFVTATHDKENPASGRVMRRIGMSYRYSYHEHWMPKDLDVVFRMYQIDLNGEDLPTYGAYRRMDPNWMVEVKAYKRRQL